MFNPINRQIHNIATTWNHKMLNMYYQCFGNFHNCSSHHKVPFVTKDNDKLAFHNLQVKVLSKAEI